MQKRIITDLDCFKKFETSTLNMESNLYYDNVDSDILLKILNILLRTINKTESGIYNYKREDTVKIISNFQRENCAFPIEGIYNESDKFIGYSMKYYKNCTILKRLFTKHNLSYQDKINIITKIFETLDFFEENGIGYVDLHSGNVIVDKNNNPIFVDLDSVILKDLYPIEEYKGILLYSQKRAMKISLNLLLEMSVEKFCKLMSHRSKRILRLSNNKQAEFIKYLTSCDYKYFDWHEYVEQLDQEFIYDAQYELKIKR